MGSISYVTNTGVTGYCGGSPLRWRAHCKPQRRARRLRTYALSALAAFTLAFTLLLVTFGTAFAAPSVTTVSPDTVAQGVTGVVIDITGTGFDADPVGVDGNPVAVVTFSNPDISISSTVITTSLIQVAISVAQPGPSGPAQ